MSDKLGKIRILHVAQAAGGVDRYIRMLFKYMDHDKFENILVCSHDFKRVDYNGLADAFEHVDMQRPIGKADIDAMKAVRRLIRKYQPDIVYAHSSKAGAIARVANIGLKKNDTDGHSICGVERKNKWFTLPLKKWPLRSATKLSVSQRPRNSRHWIKRFASKTSCK